MTYKKPTGLKELQGTDRADRANPDEPRPVLRLPDRPPWVDDDHQTAMLFDQVTKYVHGMGIATEVDGIAMSLLADQLGLYIELRKAIRTDGVTITVTGSKGQERRIAHPAIPQLNQTLGIIHKFLREYGLTAASRGNVSVLEPNEIDEFEDFLGG